MYTFTFNLLLLLIINTVIIAKCSPECINGRCIAPNVCECSDGWEGANCDQGILLSLLKTLHV